MLPQLEDGFEDARDLAVRLLGGHQLIPRLQQMAEFTVGELQPGIERGYQLLVGARAVDCSRQQFPVASEVFCFSVKNAAITAGVS